MTKSFGVSDAVLDAIELRLIGCDFRPWFYAPDLRRIIKHSRKDLGRALTKAACYENGEPRFSGDAPATRVNASVACEELQLFTCADAVTHDTAKFVAQAPEDVETLLREVRALRARLAQVEASREAAVLELDALKDEHAKTRKALTQVRDCWRNLLRAVQS